MATRHLLDLVSAVAPTDASVLIAGESGSGKELVAQAIHDRSSRSSGALIAVNCGAIPSDLIESELFGHKKGSFTGAISDQVGQIEAAHKGTLFLDEIGDMPLAMQVKLLRVLQEKSVLPIGSNRPVPVDIRVVAASHRNLEEEIRQERFRADLYYRLNVVPLVVSALRERREEVPALIEHFAQQFAASGTKPLRLSAEFMDIMQAYDWPGNVRELSNMVHRLSVLYPGKHIRSNDVEVTMLPAGMAETMSSTTVDEQTSLMDMFAEAGDSVPGSNHQQPATDGLAGPLQAADHSSDIHSSEVHSSEVNDVEDIIMRAQGFDDFRRQGQSLKGILSEIEQDLIERALRETDGNVSRCAKLLRMQRTTLIERIKKYDLKMIAA